MRAGADWEVSEKEGVVGVAQAPGLALLWIPQLHLLARFYEIG